MKIRGWEDGKKRARGDDVKMKGCEDEQLRRCEDMKM